MCSISVAGLLFQQAAPLGNEAGRTVASHYHILHNCFNPLSLFELCFPIDWRLLVDWDISNSGQLENSFFSDWFGQFLCFGCFLGVFGLCEPAYCAHSGAVSRGKVYGCGFGCWRYGQVTGDIWHVTRGTWHMTQPTHDIWHNPHMTHDKWIHKQIFFISFTKKNPFFGIGASTCTQREIHCLSCAGLSLIQSESSNSQG